MRRVSLIRWLMCGLSIVVLFQMTSKFTIGQGINASPMAELRRMTQLVKDGYSEYESHNIARRMVQPYASDQAFAEALSQLLSDEQMAWQAKRVRDIDEAKLIRVLNRELQLEKLPEYLQLQPHELRRVRVFLWTEVPKLNGGISKKQLRKGVSVVDSSLSPFEAFHAASFLIYQKYFNNDFVRTIDEWRNDAGSPVGTAAAGLHVGAAPSNRQMEFREHVRTLVKANWTTSKACLDTIKRILKEGRDE